MRAFKGLFYGNTTGLCLLSCSPERLQVEGTATVPIFAWRVLRVHDNSIGPSGGGSVSGEHLFLQSDGWSHILTRGRSPVAL